MRTKQTYGSFLRRLVCLLMSLHVLNLSIDTPDQYGSTFQRLHRVEDLSINDIESYTEFFLEVCFGIDDAIPEHDEPDDDSDLLKLKQDYFFFAKAFAFTPALPWVHRKLARFTQYQTGRAPMHVLDIPSPPPQFV
ncbi:hypothetical protein ACFQ4C_04000 [Larkinella insperata]|uniref:Uncharacterized protein n=1 Tax=Larkinella insperata TaxID=332158 RepID=A0ABW3Q0E5_9BACT|nr:hypothetical protein [Larkinella insperata]